MRKQRSTTAAQKYLKCCQALSFCLRDSGYSPLHLRHPIKTGFSRVPSGFSPFSPESATPSAGFLCHFPKTFKGNIHLMCLIYHQTAAKSTYFCVLWMDFCFLHKYTSVSIVQFVALDSVIHHCKTKDGTLYRL